MAMTAEDLQDYRDSLSTLSAPELQAQLGDDPEIDTIIQSLLDAGKAVDLKSGANIGNDDGEADDVKAGAVKQPGATDDDDDDDDGEQTFVDEHGRPVADPNSAEAQAAAAAAAEAGAGAAAPAPAGDAPAALPPLDLSFLDADMQAKMDALDASKAEQFKKLMAGEIEPEDYSKAESQYMRDRDALAVDKQAQAAWITEIHNFKAHALATSGINYDADPAKLESLDMWVKTLATKNPDKPDSWALAEGHKKVMIEYEITPQAAPAPAKSVAAEKIVAKPNGRAPNLAAIPPTLGAIPAATTVDAGDGGEFAHLDNLSGLAYERAIAAMTPEQRDRYGAM